jgi:MFS family permease
MASRKLFTLLFIQLFLLGIGGSVVGPLIPILSGSFNVSLDIVGSTLSLNAFGLLLASMFSGILSERLGKKNIVALGSILFTLSFMGLYLSGNFIYFSISYLLFGLSWGTITLNSNALISDTFELNRGRAIIRLNIGFLLGCAFAPLIVSGILSFDIKYRYIFLFLALANAILFISILLLKHESFNIRKSKEDLLNFFSVYRKFLSNKIIIFCAIISFLHFGIGFSFGAWFTTYFESINIPVNISSLILSSTIFAFCLGMLLKSSLVDKLNEEKLMRFFAILAFVFLFGAFISDNLILKIIFLILFNFSFSGIGAMSLSTAIKQNPHYSGPITGVINSFGFTGTIIFQYTAGYLSENYSAVGIFYTSLGALVLMIIFAGILNHHSGTRKEIK